MEEQENKIHQLAIRYFEGKISLSEEETLFRFVKANSGNYELFRQWEKNWILLSAPDFSVMNEWKRLQRRVQLRTSSPDIFRKRLYSLRQIASVAAIITIILLGGTYSIFTYWQQNVKTNYFALETAYGEKSKMVLTDGTIVWLNAGSFLQYGDNFNAKNREVILKGEAYFEVQHQDDNTPFLVKTDTYNVLVKGTKFNVSSYTEDIFSTTTLLEGAIDILYKGKHLPVHPGEAFSFNKEKGIYSYQRVQASQYKSWIEGRVEYDVITLNELAVRLSRKYDMQIHLDDSLDKNATFRVSLRNEETINDVLYALSEIIPISFERHDRLIYIRKQ